jgi:hypothetical protein
MIAHSNKPNYVAPISCNNVEIFGLTAYFSNLFDNLHLSRFEIFALK